MGVNLQNIGIVPSIIITPHDEAYTRLTMSPLPAQSTLLPSVSWDKLYPQLIVEFAEVCLLDCFPGRGVMNLHVIYCEVKLSQLVKVRLP